MDAFKTVYAYAFKKPKDMVLAIVFVFLETAVELAIPFLMSMLLDDGVTEGDMGIIYLDGGLIFACAALSLWTGLCFAHYSAKAAANFGYAIRKAQFQAIENFSFSNLNAFVPSSLVTRVINDSALMQNTLAVSIRPVFRAPWMLILGVGFSLAIDWRLALVFFAVIPVLGIILWLILKAVSPKFLALQRGLDGLNLVIQEGLVAIRVIKAFVREPYEEEKFAKANADYTEIVQSTFRLANLVTPLTALTMYAGTVLIMAIGGTALLEGTLKAGSLTGVFSYVMQTVNSLMLLTNVALSVARSLASCYRVNQVLKTKPDILDGPDKNRDVTQGKIEFENVSFKYAKSAKRDVVTGLSFAIRPGEAFGIVGATGSGKSTVASLMLRLYDATQGEVRIDDVPIRDYSLYRLREGIGMVFQKNTLFSGTVEENLKWGNPNATHDEVMWAVRMACVDEFLPKLPQGLATSLGTGGGMVSGGQKQRLCIARALLKHPRILILDDATSALDTATERRLMENLKGIPGMTVVVISQRILTMANADRILVLDNGRMSGLGTPKELLGDNAIYRQFVALQTQGEANHG